MVDFLLKNPHVTCKYFNMIYNIFNTMTRNYSFEISCIFAQRKFHEKVRKYR